MHMSDPQHKRIAGIYCRISDDKDATELGVRRQETDTPRFVPTIVTACPRAGTSRHVSTTNEAIARNGFMG